MDYILISLFKIKLIFFWLWLGKVVVLFGRYNVLVIYSFEILVFFFNFLVKNRNKL